MLHSRTRLARAESRDPSVSNVQASTHSRHRWLDRATSSPGLGLASLVLTVGVVVGCNEPRFLVPAPTLRGITIPLPPPSFADEVLVHIDVAGTIPFGFGGPGTQAYLYEKSTGRGYFVDTDGVSFTIFDVLVDVNDNCLETWFVDPIDKETSTFSDYKAVLRDGEACSTDDSCSAPDDLGVCLCLEQWTVGC
jgi:hypothetical protein